MKMFFIFIRAFAIVALTTANIWLISNKFYKSAVMLSVFISITWTYNVKDLSLADWKDRTAYVLGALLGTIITLYMPIWLGYEHI